MSIEYKGKKYDITKDERSGLLKLSLIANDIRDITEIKGLRELTNLEQLDLNYNKISEIKGLKNLTNLQKLDLSKNKITEIKGLDTLKNLKELSFYENQITEIKGLENLTNLEDLQLGRNKIKEIKGLENLTNLKHLFLSNNQISEIKELDNLTNLQCLSLSENQITEIKGLENLTNLEILSLSSNHISEIKGLDKLNKLRTLQLHENQITEIKGLENLSILRDLWLCDNNITEIKGLKSLTNLEHLWFENNQVSELKGLENLKNLITLYLKNNKITEVKGLANLNKLLWLELYENPVYEWTVKEFGDSEYCALQERHLPYVIAYCKKIDEKSKEGVKPSMIDTNALNEFLIKDLETKINEKFSKESYTSFEALALPKGNITLITIDHWIWVKSRFFYLGARWDPSTDRAKGDRYDAHHWRDWIGLANSAPTKVSRPEELDKWAILATTYFREYTDTGDWGKHEGQWISELQEDGTVTIQEAEGVFHDVSPEKSTTVKQLRFK